MTTALLAALGASTGYALAAVLQALAVRRSGIGAAALARSPWYLLALLGDGTAWLLSLMALRRLPLFTVQSILAGSLALTVVLARLFLGARLRRVDTVAIVVMVCSLAAVGGAGQESRATALGPHATAGLLAVVAALLLTYVTAGLVERRPRGRALPGWAFAALAGLSFSCAAVAARAIHAPGPPHLPGGEGPPGSHDPPLDLVQLLTEPLAWTVVVAGVLGIRAYAAAMHHGGIGKAAALLWGMEVVASALAGLHLLGDDVRPGWELTATLGVTGVLVSAVVLALSPGERAAEEGHPLPPPL
ncbi:hypothetical protein CLV92_10329 [Kineococcus xinjiangensis]|uniref:EamA-like transporter family protein n=1 Tax=Kineococcus xinjiangensis TaxID=512762 RepID=A0A2S6ITD0_9ACTN|nr:hypothetical protein [Kineococcus xinjiangensis]PPK97499.1 hypothetical protein CLV92_10329 [Kineococcus xinjiangensis]